MTEETKIISFPQSKVVREIPEDHLKARQERMNQKVADAIAEEVTSIMLSELDNNGLDVDTPTFMKDFVLAADALKGCVYRQFGIDHHLHQFADNNVKIIDGDVSGMTPEEIREKIESVISELKKAKESIEKENVDNPDE